jgi:hypothetical protein
MSRNASSRDSGSTTSVTAWNVAMIASEIWEYRVKSGSTTMPCGQSRRALPIGIAEVTPNRRAS